MADALERKGIASERAPSVASVVVAAIEGGIVIARARRSTEPLERVAAEIERVVASALSA